MKSSRFYKKINRALRKTMYVRAMFMNRGLKKVLNGIIPPSQEEIEQDEVLSLSEALSKEKIGIETPIGFKSIPELVGIDYVGYIIDKERLSKTTGRWIRTDEYKIVGAEINNFKDTRLAYGQTYRYRIRSVVKVTVALNKESFDPVEVEKDLNRLKTDLTKESLLAKQILLENIENTTNLGLTHKVSSGRTTEEIELIEGLVLQNSAEGSNVTSSSTVKTKTAQEIRRELNSAIKDSDLLRGVVTAEFLQKKYNELSKDFLEEFIEYRSFYYAGEPSRQWAYVHIEENIPPPPPSNIKIVPNSIEKNIRIMWLKPVNIQRDIKYIKLYRRLKIGDPWENLGKFEANQTFYLDNLEQFKAEDGSINYNNKYIYAFIAQDIHGIDSFLSMQIQAELNPKFAIEKEERKLKWISGSGTKLEETDLILKKFLDDTEAIVAKKNIKLSPTPEFNDVSKNLLIKVTSLDTHEKKEFKVTLKNINITRGEQATRTVRQFNPEDI
jgi:hypothetical protein